VMTRGAAGALMFPLRGDGMEWATVDALEWSHLATGFGGPVVRALATLFFNVLSGVLSGSCCTY
jgi:hypothetical protein